MRHDDTAIVSQNQITVSEICRVCRNILSREERERETAKRENTKFLLHILINFNTCRPSRCLASNYIILHTAGSGEAPIWSFTDGPTI